MYGYAFSLFLIAIGAILRFAVTGSTRGFDVNVAGVVLILIGIGGLVLSFGLRLLEHDEYAGEENMVPRRRWYRRY